MSELPGNESTNKQYLNNYFGVCPVCAKTDGFMLQRPSDPSDGITYGWHVCLEHKKKWSLTRVVSSYRHLSDEILEFQYAQVESCDVVEGAYPVGGLTHAQLLEKSETHDSTE